MTYNEFASRLRIGREHARTLVGWRGLQEFSERCPDMGGGAFIEEILKNTRAVALGEQGRATSRKRGRDLKK